jgi:hypothetical protein
VANFDGGDNTLDGLFTLNIDYELNHDNLETGTAKLVRTKEGDLWKTVLSTTSTNNPVIQLIPIFEVTMKSDHKTMLEGTYTCEDGNNYKLNVNRIPGESIVKAVLEGSGRTYILNCKLDKEEMTVKIDLDANGQDYEVDLDFNDKADEYELEASANLGASGSYKVELELSKDYSGASIKVDFNDRAIVNAKLKGKLDKDNHVVKNEVIYTAAHLGEGKIRFGLVCEPNQELKIQYLPKTGLDLKIELTRDVHDDGSRYLKGLVTRGAETYIQFTNDLIPTFNPDSYELSIESQLDINEKSRVYPIFCSYGCFKQPRLSGKLYVEKAMPYKFSADVEVTKDEESVFTIDLNTRNNPYVFKLVAPRLLPKITDDGRDTFEMEADHNPGQYLNVTSNSPCLKSFKVEKIGDDMCHVKLNGKELMRGAFTKGSNEISLVTELSDGSQPTTTITWATEDMKKNKVNVKLDGMEHKIDGSLEWDMTDHDNMLFNILGKGEEKSIGAYSFERHMTVNCDHGKHLVVDWKSNSKVEELPWLNNVDSGISADLDCEHKAFNVTIQTNAVGRNYRLMLQNGGLSVDVL